MNVLRKLILSGLFLALAMVLPFLTGQIPQIGNMLCPMHLPVLLCGFLCGWPYGLLVGFLSPFLRYLLFHMPPLFPTGLAMAFEMATYGAVAGLLYRALPRRTVFLYLSLIVAMLAGRLVWGGVRYLLTFVSDSSFTLAAFWAGGFATALPAIILQLVLIPPIVLLVRKAGYLPS